MGVSTHDVIALRRRVPDLDFRTLRDEYERFLDEQGQP